MTAREIIEARIGRKLPPVKDMAPDERQAVSMLAKQLIKNKARRALTNNQNTTIPHGDHR